MDEFDGLIEKICNASSPPQIRAQAEQRLMEILSDRNAWKNYANFLFQANDTMCFFICIGMQRMVWKHWRNISMEDRMLLNQTVVQALSGRPQMQPFAKSKLEQVLATICANSCSIEPALGLLTEAENPAVVTGLSAMRTVLELILSEDPQLFPEYRPTLQSAVQDILVPLTNLACNACNISLSAASNSLAASNSNAISGSTDEQRSTTIMVSLELLKVIITKLQIGPHVTSSVIDLLFTIAELGAAAAANNNNNTNAANLNRAALSAIEVLTEIMSKRYLPPSPSNVAAVAIGGGGGGGIAVPITTSSNSATTNGSLGILMDIVVKTVSLLKKIR